MERLTSRDDTARRTRYIPEPGVKQDDLLQRLGRCEETLVRITYCVKRANDGRSATECIAQIRMALRALDADAQKDRSENG
jgi:hypothetical protein